jgi:hypothetical protein
MKPISHVKLFRGGRLPTWDEPIVIVTFEQAQDDRFFAEYFVVFPKSQRLDARRFAATENVKEYLKLRPPESVITDMADDACREIEGKVVESLPQEQQHQWLLQSSEQGASGSASRAPRRDCFRHNQGQ